MAILATIFPYNLDETPVVSRLSFHSPSPVPQSSKKTPLFSWSKGTSKSSSGSPSGDNTKSALVHVPDHLEDIVHCFDKTTKPLFRNAEEPEYVKFGSARDNDKRAATFAWVN